MDTDFELKKRLRFDDGTTNGTLAYDHEQRALRDAFVAKGLASDADGSDDGEGSGDDERGGLQVRMRAKKVPRTRPATSSTVSSCCALAPVKC